MALFAYAVRRTIAAVIVFLVVVGLTMFAVANVDHAPIRSLPEHVVPQVDAWTHISENWATSPMVAVGMVASAITALALRRRFTR
jgi:hypothetical protein